MEKLNNTFIKRKSFAILAFCVITSLFYMHYLQAEPLPQRGPIPFRFYDINSNGSISQDEFNTIRGLRMESRATQGRPTQNMALEPNFNQFDTDKDGQLNPNELTRGQQSQRQKRWEMRQGQGVGMSGDRNMSGFKDFDQDQDGLLTPEEFTSGMQQHIKNCQNMRQGTGIQKRQGLGRSMRRGRNMAKFEYFDGNNDGYISEQELNEARSMRISSRIQQGYQMRNTENITPFQNIDTNADGKISQDEFSA